MTDNNDLWELDRGDYVNIITELRADLAEARADVARWEAALDVANRELAEAKHRLVLSVDDIAHGATEAVKWEKRAREAERDVRGLRNDRDLWRDAAYEAADVSEELERSRRTIRALVVAARAMWRCHMEMAYIDSSVGDYVQWISEKVCEVENEQAERGQAGKDADNG